MKALQIVQYGDLREGLAFKEVTKPTPGPSDLLIEVKAAGLNPIDYKMVNGHLKDMIPLDLPSTIGYDVSGVVIDKGADVSAFAIGDAVYARVPQEQMGSLAEYLVCEHKIASRKPDIISFEEAAGLPLAGLTAIQALERVNLQKDEKVLIHAGSGGVGSFAIQYAKHKGAYVYTTTSTKNLAWVKALGADRVIDYKEEDYQSVVADLDVVFDTLGDKYTLEAFQVIKDGGRVSSIASIPDEETAALMGMKDYSLPEDFQQLIKKRSATYKLTWMQPNGEQLDTISKLVRNSIIKPVVDKVYALEDGLEAYTHLASGRAKGKVIISLA